MECSTTFAREAISHLDARLSTNPSAGLFFAHSTNSDPESHTNPTGAHGAPAALEDADGVEHLSRTSARRAKSACRGTGRTEQSWAMPAPRATSTKSHIQPRELSSPADGLCILQPNLCVTCVCLDAITCSCCPRPISFVGPLRLRRLCGNCRKASRMRNAHMKCLFRNAVVRSPV